MIRRVDVKDACGFITYSDILPILNISQATLFRSIKKGSFPPPDGTINKVKYYRKETIFKAALKTKGLDVAMHYAKQMDFDFSHLELNDIEK
jgi:predicted DNA-binding transcriptional regulator AlpA